MPQPGHDHSITVAPHQGRVRVVFAGEVVAETRRALALVEGDIPTVLYIPREDAAMAFFESSDHSSHCPFKGDARYFSLKVGEKLAENAAWSYEQPIDAVAAIREHLAFYPDRVDAIEESAA